MVRCVALGWHKSVISGRFWQNVIKRLGKSML